VFRRRKERMIYHLGCVLENMGKKDESVEQFKTDLRSGYRYRDRAAKVDAYYSGRAKRTLNPFSQRVPD